MPQLRERGGSNGACPDAATVLAVIEGEADEWLRHAYAHHLAQCSACLDLDSRLRNFDRPVLADEAEWRQTEKRLDNWMGRFLDARPAAAVSELAEPQPASVGFWHSLWRPGLAWKLSLATALLALVAVGVDVYLRLQPPVQPNQANVAPSAPHAEETKPVAPPAANVTPTEVPKSTEQETPVTSSPLPGGGMPRNGGPMATVPKAAPPQSKPEETVTVAQAVAPSEPQHQAALNPPAGLPVPGPRPRGTAPEQTTSATTMGKPRPGLTESAGKPATCATCAIRPHVTASAPAMANVATGRPIGRTPDAQAPPAAANLPTSLHLATGARLWLALDSFTFQTDSQVVFHGSLLLPLSSAGSSPLDHGTEVSGFVTSTQGQTSVRLSEIVIRGAHYKLKSQAGAGNARTAGSGGAVQFDSGKVLEMWVSSDSIYERATADSTQ